MITSRLFLVFCLTSCLNAHYDIDDTLLYKIDFKPFSTDENSLKSPITSSPQDPANGIGKAKAESSQTEERKEENPLNTVIITSVDKEKFRCQIPEVINASFFVVH